MPKPQEAIPATSSLEPVLDDSQRKFFSAVLKQLNRHGVAYAVTGAFALQQYTGVWRGIKDLDVCLTSEQLAAALPALCDYPFHCEISDPVWLAKIREGDHFADLITGMSNAALLVRDSWIERARPAVLLGIQTRVLAPEELMASKLFVAHRERFDGADVLHVIFRSRGALDWDHILDLMSEHWGLLFWALVLFQYVYPAHADYVPARVWALLMQRFQKEISTVNRAAPFRGSLIDENMFAIDVREWGLDDVMAENRARIQKIDLELGTRSEWE